MKKSPIQVFKQLELLTTSYGKTDSLVDMILVTRNVLKNILGIEDPDIYLLDQVEQKIKRYSTRDLSLWGIDLPDDDKLRPYIESVYHSGKKLSLPGSRFQTNKSKTEKAGYNHSSSLLMPIVSGEEITGVLHIRKEKTTQFREESALLSLIVNMAGAAYSNKLNKNLLELANHEIVSFAKLATESPNPVIRISLDKVLQYANKASQPILDHFGLNLGEVVNYKVIDKLIESINLGISAETEVTIGKTVYSFISSTIPEADYINLYGRDITSRKKMEIELKRLAIVAKEIENSIIISNEKGQIEWVNESFTRITEYTPEEVIGRRPAEFLVGEESDPLVVEQIAETIRNHKTLEIDVVNYSKSNRKYWIKLQLQPVFSSSGQLENYISIQKEITREKETEQELLKTTSFQKAILNSSAIAIISTNLDGIIQSFNHAACQMFGYDAEEVIGIKTPLIFHDRKEIERRFQQSQDQNICYFGICEFKNAVKVLSLSPEVAGYTCVNKNGSRFPVTLTVTALRDETNSITGYLGMAKDISALQKQYDELQVANLRFRSLISSMQAGVMVEDENRNIVLVNQYFCDMFSLPITPDQMVGADCEPAAEASMELFTNPEMFVKDINNTLELRTIVTNFELQMVNGRTFERDFIPLEDVGRKNHGILWIYRDITIRKTNERDLVRQSRILNGTAQAMNYLLTLHDHDLAIKKALETIGVATGVDRVYIFENIENPETGEALFSQQFEWTALGIVPQIGNQELQNMSYKENFPDWYNTLKAGHTVSGLRDNFPENERLILEDQDIKSILAAPIFVQDQLWGMVGFDDCTIGIEWSENELSIIKALAGSIGGSISKRIIENELIGARHIAEYATKTKSEFLATMSHEIRTPMNGVIGMTSLLMQTQLSPDQRDYAETIRVSGELLLDVINDILDFSKIESGKMILEEQHFDLRLAIEDVLDLMAAATLEKNLGLFFEVDPSIPGKINGDLTRLRQILVNLAGNAVKFTPGGEIVIGVKQIEKIGEKVILEFSIKDTGVGIPNEKIGLLFKPFSQVDASTTRKFGGTGLGLAICAKLIDLMHGKIWVKSEVGKGTEFIFTIQTSYESEMDATETSSTGSVLLKGKKILIVDGNVTSSQILTNLLVSYKMIPIVVDSAVEALKILGTMVHPDLVLVDYDSLELEVTTFAARLKEKVEQLHTPVVLMVPPSVKENLPTSGSGSLQNINKPLRHSQLLTEFGNIFAKNNLPKSQNVTITNPIQKINNQFPLNILVAEDNAINQKLIGRLFEMLGYNIHIAANGYEVLEALKRMKIDIIFMDIQMPEMDGLEATRQIIELWGERKPMIVAMTANALYTDKDKCLAAGMDDYISKPLTINQVRNGIEKWAPFCHSHP